ncbi:hypothetical protein [Paenibacillus sp. 276b]|uniref:hypothetical protein n=1 Tax=Paenibacillus sp. 276b TaxID=1566277 RepID=UPI000895AA01|nr:hypothetical protein [Paenibacillus sp. 276b]SEB06595.1 hypothetical protein SAMN03159332_3236 [Paenibacillus sp. 276b]
MVNEVVVRIAAARILNKGLNPKTSQVYLLNDITNTDYRQVIEDYILEKTEGI